METLGIAMVFLGMITCAVGASSSDKQVYVVYLGSTIHNEPELTSSLNHEILASVHSGSLDAAKESIIYSYKHGFRGFSAKLTEEQAATLARRGDVAKVFKSEVRQLHTTRSYEFLGLPMSEVGGIPHSSSHHKVILGVFDTGIWPESESFSDHRMPPVPKRWKGGCMAGENFTAKLCNRKLIGAKYYLKGMEEQMGPPLSFSQGGSDVLSPRDSVGHGTHTASTAAGRLVESMNLRGLASGRARGGAPRARIAAYKVCWSPGCFDADILAAFDDAIKDGVDVLSMSLGPDPPQNDYFMDAISIGSFHAFRAGITVVGSVGNNGPSGSSATNVAPWILTVASTSIDRDFPSTVILGNHIRLEGESLTVKKASAELVYGGKVGAHTFTPQQSSACLNSSLDPRKVRGKVVVCRHQQDAAESRLGTSKVVQAAGGVGMVLIDELGVGMGVSFVIPAVLVGNRDGQTILSYINYTKYPTIGINGATTILGFQPAPRVSIFSSRGPNTITPDVLKPDIAAPGLNILAAWSPLNMGLDYNIVSGTSMSAPHVAGIALLLKAANPTWSPATIKSALMTTATGRDNENKVITSMPSGKKANALEIGGGQVQPRKAQNPGLVYESGTSDIVSFLCSSGYDAATLQLITADKHSACPSSANSSTPADLNYPAVSLSRVSPAGTRRIMRSVTNVGLPATVYRARVKPPLGVDVRVVPDFLAFTHYGQSLSYFVEFKVVKAMDDYVFGSLTWTNGKHKVRTPLVLKTVSED
eukprot:c21458_g1_i1 orf=102-2381(+)